MRPPRPRGSGYYANDPAPYSQVKQSAPVPGDKDWRSSGSRASPSRHCLAELAGRLPGERADPEMGLPDGPPSGRGEILPRGRCRGGAAQRSLTAPCYRVCPAASAFSPRDGLEVLGWGVARAHAGALRTK